MTIVMGFGVAIMQPALPTLVRQWVPDRVALGTAVSSNGLLVGVAAGPALTIPLVLPLVGQSWRLDFLVWSVPGADRGAAVSRGGDALARRKRKRATSPRRGAGGRTGRTR